MLAVALKPFEHGHHLLRRRAVNPVRDQLGVAEDGVERRAQLVAHVGEELRLVLARLGKLAALVLDFVEQPDVLDCDRSLVGEGRNQFDLLFRERTDLGSCERQDADCGAIAQHGHAQKRSIAAESLRLRSRCSRDRPLHRECE